jgi:uncharacterized protein (DUF2147 family)
MARTRQRRIRHFRTLAIAFLLLPVSLSAAPQSLIGLWLTQDRDGIIAVSSCDGGLCAEIAGLILDHPDDPTPVDYRGVSQCHLPLITDAKQVQPNLWKGHITNPRNGGIYGVELRLDPHGNLALRGFLGVPLLGRTQTWTRYAGAVPDDCRLHAGSPELTQSRTLPKPAQQAK